LPNSGVEDVGFGVEGDGVGPVDGAEVNENTVHGVELKGEIPEPVFRMPNGDGAVVIKLLPNIGDAKNVVEDPKAEVVAGKDRGVVFTKVEPEAAVKETTELKGLELEGAELN
jgi:hypothetical protein